MKKKLCLIFLITIISFFSVSIEVSAGSNAAGWSSLSGGNYNSKGGVPGAFSNYALQGYRITIFEKNGKDAKPIRAKKSNGEDVDSIDYIMYSNISESQKKLKILYTIQKNRSKVDYLNDKNYRNNILNKNITIGDLLGRADTKKGTNIGSNKRFPWPYGNASTNDKKKNNNLNLRDWFNRTKVWNDKTLNLSKNDVKRIINSGGLNSDSNVDCSKYYVVMEPLLLVSYESNVYFGTAYELSYKIMKNGKYSPIKGTGLYILNSVLRTSLPGAIYASTAQDYDKINYFVGNGPDYFIKAIVFDSKNRYTKEEITSNDGLGIGVFWLGNGQLCNSPVEPSCDPDKTFDSDNTAPDGTSCCIFYKDDENVLNNHPECFNDCNYKVNYSIDSDGNDTSRCTYSSMSSCDVSNSDNDDKGDNETTIIVEDVLEEGINDDKCLNNDGINDDSKASVQTYEINNYCSVKCIETDIIRIPSDPKLTVNTYHFVWPTSPSTSKIFGNNYPLTASGNVSCRIIVKSDLLKKEKNESALNECAALKNLDYKKLNQFNPTIELSHEKDSKKQPINYKTLEVYDDNTNCVVGNSKDIESENKDCDKLKVEFNQSDFDKKVDELVDFRFGIEKSKRYKLPVTLNAYVNKNTKNATSKIEDGNLNYTVIGYGNIPINFMSEKQSYSYVENKIVKGTLNLRININSKHFSEYSKEYFNCSACYEAKYDKSIGDNLTKYYCKSGTKSAGKNISKCVDNGVINNKCVIEECSLEEFNCSMTTAAPGKKINIDKWENKYNYYKDNGYDDKLSRLYTQDYFDNSEYCTTCDNCDYSCPIDTEFSGRDITDCVNNSKIEDVEKRKELCIELECNGNRYQCPDNTDFPGYDLNDCIMNSKEKDRDKAKKKCTSLICYKKDIEPIVIVRSIDLNNPFPSIKGITESSDEFGRLPGYNWRINESLKKEDQMVVQMFITNNRGVNTTEVYQKKPLYTFELNTDKIKKIKEYNKVHSYDDFELDCDESGRRCISDSLHFVHNTSYGFVDYSSVSACNSIEKNKFYNCLEG